MEVASKKYLQNYRKKVKNMTSTPRVRISTNGITKTKIHIDGEELKGVTGVRFLQNYKENNGLPILQIDMQATNVELDAKMLPALPEPFSKHYVSLNTILSLETLNDAQKSQLCRELGIELVTDALIQPELMPG